MSLIKGALFVSIALVLLVPSAGCSGARATKAGPYGNNYVKGFPVESSERPTEFSREPVNSRDRDLDAQRMIDEAERQRREEEQERQEQPQQRELDRVNVGGGGERCLSCP